MSFMAFSYNFYSRNPIKENALLFLDYTLKAAVQIQHVPAWAIKINMICCLQVNKFRIKVFEVYILSQTYLNQQKT